MFGARKNVLGQIFSSFYFIINAIKNMFGVTKNVLGQIFSSFYTIIDAIKNVFGARKNVLGQIFFFFLFQFSVIIFEWKKQPSAYFL